MDLTTGGGGLGLGTGILVDVLEVVVLVSTQPGKQPSARSQMGTQVGSFSMGSV